MDLKAVEKYKLSLAMIAALRFIAGDTLSSRYANPMNTRGRIQDSMYGRTLDALERRGLVICPGRWEHFLTEEARSLFRGPVLGDRFFDLVKNSFLTLVRRPTYVQQLARWHDTPYNEVWMEIPTYEILYDVDKESLDVLSAARVQALRRCYANETDKALNFLKNTVEVAPEYLQQCAPTAR